MRAGPDPRKSPPSFLVFSSVHRFTSNSWNLVPEAPAYPAFFLGALPIALSPLDTFMKLEVCAPPALALVHPQVLSLSSEEGLAPHEALRGLAGGLSIIGAWTVPVSVLPSLQGPRGLPGVERVGSKQRTTWWYFSGSKFLSLVRAWAPSLGS